MPKGGPKKRQAAPAEAASYRHPEAESYLRPDVGTQAQFKKRKPPAKYRYDDSLSPALEWDGQNGGSRDRAERLLATIQRAQTLEDAKRTAAELAGMSRPFLNWAGKAERLSFDVPTLPLFVHERLSTKAIVETLRSHRKDAGAEQMSLFELFGDPQRSVTDQVLKAYEYKDKWVNRMVLGDSLVVMNSLLQYEGLGGQVQMIYLDPPYGVRFGSNFQPFVRKRDVSHSDDEDMTREPEMVKAYRDTWELGLHTYLTYMRDRLRLARELLTHSGSIFVQISDENLHHVREVLDEVFGAENAVSVIPFVKTAGLGASGLPVICDYLLWYARDRERMRYHQVYASRGLGDPGSDQYTWIELRDRTRRQMTAEEKDDGSSIPAGARAYRLDNLTSGAFRENTTIPYDFEGRTFHPGSDKCWKTTKQGLDMLAKMRRLQVVGNTLAYVRFIDDFPVQPLKALWTDTGTGGYAEQKLYVVQTTPKAIQRCMLMTSDPGDLVLDPTCGSGTTAYVAEQWGRRWITIDTSRVPLALARQRLLTATFPWYELKDENRGPVSGLVYKPEGQSRNPKSIGPGIVHHVTLGSIANGEQPEEEVLVDRPEVSPGVTRVSGPFTVEATIPTPINWEADGTDAMGAGRVSERVSEEYGTFVDRMLEVLRKSPVIQVGGGNTVTFKNVRQPAKTLSLSGEALVVNGKEKPVAIVFGPENGAVSERLVQESAREAANKSYSRLYVIGFAIQPNARQLVDNCDAVVGIPATYIQATPDLMMGDLLKGMRSSQVFSVCGLPEIRIISAGKQGARRYTVELLGLDVFDPSTMDTVHKSGDDVPAWFLDTDYNGLAFKVGQAFFPRTGAWDGLKRALKATHEESVWDHLAGTKSAPFEAGEHGHVAVKVIDDRGNELLVVKSLKDAE